MAEFDQGLAEAFVRPTALPKDPGEAKEWQAANQAWWERTPMRYDWRDANTHEEFSAAFYNAIDDRFFASASTYLSWRATPFESLIPFDDLHDKTVLEIGVGNGSHAALLARAAGRFIGIDLTSYAVTSTRRRLDLLGIGGIVEQMDAEALALPDDSVDFVWSWGVIHHSADTGRALREIRRVLRPGGHAVVMVYHRSWWNYYVMGLLFRGILRGDLLRTRSLHRTVQRGIDGALARFYSADEWRQLATSAVLTTEWVRVLGDKIEMIPLPQGHAKDVLYARIPNGLSRLLLERMRGGTFLVSQLRK
jgi:ubiquinone/menaquinone biosynthesis C-methylase UbiE